MLGARTDKLVTLDWDTHALRVVYAHIRRDRVRIVKAVTVPWTAQVDRRESASIGRFIRRVLDEQRIRTNRAVVDIPRDQVVLNMLELPVGEPDELPSMVHFQIVKELPFSLEEAVVDFVVPTTGSDEAGGQIEVLVAACRNEVLAFYQSVVESAGLTLERIGLRPHANLTALPPEATTGRLLYIDVGPTLTEIDIIAQGQLTFSRAASVSVPPASAGSRDAGSDAPSDEAAVNALLVEVTRTLEAYRTTGTGSAVDRAIVGGSCGIEADLVAALEKRFGFAVTLFTPPASLDLPAGQRDGLTAFSAALGLAVGHASKRNHCFDFLNPKAPEDAIRARRRKRPLVAVAVMLYVAAPLVAYLQIVRPPQAEIRSLRTEVNAQKKWEKGFKDFQSQISVARDWVEREVVWLDELDNVVQALASPTDAYVDRITMKEGELRLELRVTNVGIKNNLVKSLEAFTVGEGDDPPSRYQVDQGRFVASTDPKYKFRGSLTVILTSHPSNKKSAARWR